MKDLLPFRDAQGGPEAGAARIIERARSAEPWPLDRQAAVFWAVRRRLADDGRPRSRRLLPSLGVAAAGLALLITAANLIHFEGTPFGGAPSKIARAEGAGPAIGDGLSWTRWRRFDLADLACIDADVEGFEVRELPAERQVRLTRGVLRAHVFPQDPARPVVVITPHVRIVVVGTRFDVECTPELTTVRLLEGRVRVESAAGSVLVEGGSTIRSDDPALSPAPSPAAPTRPVQRSVRRSTARAHVPAPLAQPSAATASDVVADAATLEACRALAGAERRSCFERVARGDGLAAQNALFTLGEQAVAERRPAEAAEHFRRYGERFPRGVLAPEAALGVLELLKDQGNIDAAIAAAEDFERRFAADSRVNEVALVRAALLCESARQRGRGAAILDEVAARRLDPALREELERVRARCTAEHPSPVPFTGPAPPGGGSSRTRE